MPVSPPTCSRCIHGAIAALMATRRIFFPLFLPPLSGSLIPGPVTSDAPSAEASRAKSKESSIQVGVLQPRNPPSGQLWNFFLFLSSFSVP